MSDATLSFLPWARQGAASAITVQDTLDAKPSAVARVTATLSLNDRPLTPDVTVRLRGPGDVVGIDPNQVLRTDPRQGSADFEPNGFASIEFDRADFPWLFTPARANAARRLRPWLCLVVVRSQDGVTLETPPGAPLPVLRITGPARPDLELPNLVDSWAWAHAQAAADPGGAGAALNGGPEQSLSRLVCPRVLAPETDYIACVVPTFEAGRLSGLGRPMADATLMGANALGPAWTSPPAALVELPVYFHWAFRSGQAGDFESIAKGLTPGAPAGLGRRPIDVSQPGFDAAGVSELPLQGALRPVSEAPDPAPLLAFRQNLANRLNPPPAPDPEPELTAPIYGRWHAGRDAVSPDGTTWLDQLNLDPRFRVAAALGTRVVQANQEALMASAWEQAADLDHANQRLRQMQVSLAVGEVMHARRMSRMDEELVTRVAAPAFGRLGLAEGPSMLAQQQASSLPLGANGFAMRRIGRRRGPLTRRLAIQQFDRSSTTTWMQAMATEIAPPPPPPTVMSIMPDVPREHLAEDSYWGAFFVSLETVPPTFPGPPVLVTHRTERPGFFRDAMLRHPPFMQPVPAPAALAAPPPLTGVRARVLELTAPGPVLATLAAAAIETGDGLLAATPAGVTAHGLETKMMTPTFPAPMYEALRDLSADLLLPGLGAIGSETVLALQTNRPFVEAFMAGLNHEMARELQWRGFATDQRGTYFSRFWGAAGPVAPPDIKDLDLWGQGPLGSAAPKGAGEAFVMLLRSRLLARYPNAVIYLAPAVTLDGAVRPSRTAGAEVPPMFAGALPPDMAILGFPLPPATVLRGGPANLGYFLVIQEHPTEPRFGLDVGAAPVGTHLKVGGPLPTGIAAWGAHAGEMAGLTRRRPARVAIHATRLITEIG